MPIILDLETAAIGDADQYIEPAEAPANYKDAAKIAEYVASATARAVDRCGLDPDLCRIVALGWMFGTDKGPTVRVCKTDTEEKDTLDQFWRDFIAGGEPSMVTFNGLKFDIPVLLRRSLYLRVPHPPINLDRYRTPHIDLFNRLTFNGAIQGHSLKFYLSRFGIPNDDLTSGKDIAALVKAGEWDAVAAHCASDVVSTKLLAERIGAIRLVPEATGAF
jgi:predicted PolB exonuclease-like 3'-5' exonuclease